MKTGKFEDLRCWQAARKLVKMVYDACEDGKLATDFETRGQFKRAALSVMNNIAEGYGRYGTKDFIKFLDISRSSAYEVKSITYTLEDVNYLPLERIIQIREKADETKNMTLAFIRYLRTQ